MEGVKSIRDIDLLPLHRYSSLHSGQNPQSAETALARLAPLGSLRPQPLSQLSLNTKKRAITAIGDLLHVQDP